MSVDEFVDNPRLLEATMVRCSENRTEMKYTAECVNAREAVNRIEAVEDERRREQMEAQSERKRQALRRTQEAVAEARRRSLDAQRRREEAEYLGVFEELPPDETSGVIDAGAGNSLTENPLQPAGNAPNAEISPADLTAPLPDAIQPGEQSVDLQQDPPAATDLDSIREELKRRQQTPQ